MALGVLGVWFAVERWLWFHTLPRHADARLCGNCFLAAVGVPTELELLGLVVAGASLVKVPYSYRDATCWWLAAGIFLTPAVIGVPLFAFAFVALTVSIVSAGFKGARSGRHGGGGRE
jgi:hypothetical protein